MAWATAFHGSRHERHHINAHAALVASAPADDRAGAGGRGLAAAAALAWQETDDEVSDLLDAHLAQTAALLRLQPLDELDEDRLNEAPELDKHQPRVVFQLWHEGQLLARSASAPHEPLTQRRKRGFADSTVDGKAWRVFVTQGRESDVRILVGELQSVREEIILASLTSILKPLAWALPLLALGIWWAVRGSVRPLEQLGRAWPPASPNRWSRYPPRVCHPRCCRW